MSLTDRLSAWIGPFLPHRSPPANDSERRRRQAEQSRESEALLRQLRAELKLMKLWKNGPGREGD